jgi:hypothetical protein
MHRDFLITQYKLPDLLGCYTISIGKYLTDVSEDCSALILRVKEFKNTCWAAAYNTKTRQMFVCWHSVTAQKNIEPRRCENLKCRTVNACDMDHINYIFEKGLSVSLVYSYLFVSCILRVFNPIKIPNKVEVTHFMRSDNDVFNYKWAVARWHIHKYEKRI